MYAEAIISVSDATLKNLNTMDKSLDMAPFIAIMHKAHEYVRWSFWAKLLRIVSALNRYLKYQLYYWLYL